MIGEHVCNSCKKQISNIPRSTAFLCPSCTKHEIVRCGNCRKLAAKYVCPGCSFEGPH